MFAFDSKTGRFRLSDRCQLAADSQAIRKFVRIAETRKSSDFTCASSVYTPVGAVDKSVPPLPSICRLQTAPMSFPQQFFRWRLHPWHGLEVGPNPPPVVHGFIEISPFDLVKYEVDRLSRSGSSVSNVVSAAYSLWIYSSNVLWASCRRIDAERKIRRCRSA
jgi:hypothetical protein